MRQHFLSLREALVALIRYFIMKCITTTLALVLSLQVIAQQSDLSVYDHLLSKTWLAQGSWGNGSPFYQKIEFKYNLDESIVVANAEGYIDQEQTQIGPRNHGIRQLDQETGRIKFWEFDVFGGLTQGTVEIEGRTMRYHYDYGGTEVTDEWKYLNDSTYAFTVGTYTDGTWNQVYLSTHFKEVKKPDIRAMYDFLKAQLVGDWISPAWDGQLLESWSVDRNGHLRQSAQYTEEGEVLYEAVNKIEIVKGEIVLFTVIKDSNPKIFRASSFRDDRIIFENPDYTNPNRVVYAFSENQGFNRTISGTENGKASTYTFKFEKLEQADKTE